MYFFLCAIQSLPIHLLEGLELLLEICCSSRQTTGSSSPSWCEQDHRKGQVLELGCELLLTLVCEGTVNSHICSPVQADRIKCYWHGCSTTCMMMQPLLGNPVVLHPRNRMQGQQGACYIYSYRASGPQDLATAIQSQNHDAVLDSLESAQEPDSYGFIAATRRREPVLLTAASCGYFHSVSLLLECLGEPKHFMP